MTDIRRKFLAAAVAADDALGPRQIRVICSTPTPDRVDDVLEPNGCQLDNYNKNPIVLADHDPSKPIGRAAVAIEDDQVTAIIDFAPEGISAKADEYCGLAKAGVLGAVSVGFRALDWEPIKEGGYRFIKWELMELSLVAVPCNPEALVVQRSMSSAAKDAKSEGSWKCGASRNLPLGGDEAWDGPAAEASVFEHCKFDSDKPDTSFCRKAFLAYDASAPDLKGSYKLPFAKIVDGRLTAMPSGIRAAASRLPQSDIGGVEEKARAVLDHYEAKMKDGDQRSVTGDRKELERLAERLLAIPKADLVAALAKLEFGSLVEANAATLAKAGRVLSAENAGHLAAIKKCLDGMAACHVKSADAADELHEHLAELQQHIEEATKRANRLGRPRPKPSDDDGSDNGADEDPDTDDADSDDADSDVELAAAARRKREVELLALSAAISER